ncbi:hypothetical protein V8G54_027140 [Vigna mungo]|uniref:Uncharacterized protein n=1 Tax=Vigna mungo TaxID=3915 RepID=A0AAQ3N2B4_VIGMU
MACRSSGAMKSPFLIHSSSLKATMPCRWRAPKRKLVKLLRVSSPRKLTNTSYALDEEEVRWMMASDAGTEGPIGAVGSDTVIQSDMPDMIRSGSLTNRRIRRRMSKTFEYIIKKISNEMEFH